MLESNNSSKPTEEFAETARIIANIVNNILTARPKTEREPGPDPHKLAAEILRKREAEHLRFWHDRWFRYTGTCYESITDPTLRAEVNGCTEAIFKAKQKRTRVTRSLVGNVIAAMEAKCIVTERVVLNSWLDGRSCVDVIPVQNGLLNVGTEELEAHNPDFFNGYVLPYEFNPDAECPRWKSFLQEVLLGHVDEMDFLQEWFGYCLTPDTRYQKFLSFWGQGQNGKGVLTRMMERLVGSMNTSATSLKDLDNSFRRSALYGKLLNLSSEASNITKEAENRLKAITGEDPDQIEFKNKDPFRAKHTVKIVLSFNQKPQATDSSDALYRRMILIRMQYVVPKPDPDLERQLAQELPGILNWAIVGLRRLREQGGFTVPKSSQEEVARYKRQVNPVDDFLEDYVEENQNVDAYIRHDDFYRVYRRWTKEQGTNYKQILSLSYLGELLRDRFPRIENTRPQIDGKRVRCYGGIQWRPRDEQGNPLSTDSVLQTFHSVWAAEDWF